MFFVNAIFYHMFSIICPVSPVHGDSLFLKIQTTMPCLTYIPYCVVNHFEGWLFVVVVHSAVAMQNGDPLLLSLLTVAPVHAVVWPVVPEAGEGEETL